MHAHTLFHGCLCYINVKYKRGFCVSCRTGFLWGVAFQNTSHSISSYNEINTIYEKIFSTPAKTNCFKLQKKSDIFFIFCF